MHVDDQPLVIAAAAGSSNQPSRVARRAIYLATYAMLDFYVRRETGWFVCVGRVRGVIGIETMTYDSREKEL